MDIPKPTRKKGDPRRDDECAAATETALDGLWEHFEDAGWTEEEFNLALLEVAKRHSGDKPWLGGTFAPDISAKG